MNIRTIFQDKILRSKLLSLSIESVISVEGIVCARPEGQENKVNFVKIVLSCDNCFHNLMVAAIYLLPAYENRGYRSFGGGARNN